MFASHYDNTRSPSAPSSKSTKKIRSACDNCHDGKTKCTGGQPCAACADSGSLCIYSASNRLGRPKGSKNKRTLERNKEQAANATGDSRLVASNRLEGPLQPHFIAAMNNPEQEPTLESIMIETPVEDMLGVASTATAVPTGGFWDLFNGFEFGSVEQRGSDECSHGFPEGTSPTSCDPSRNASFQDLNGAAPPVRGLWDPFGASHAGTRPASQDTSSTYALTPMSESRHPSIVNDTGFGDHHLGLTPGFADPQHNEPITPGPLVLSPCDCLAQHIKLLYQVDDLGHVKAHSSPDVLLAGIRHAIETWNKLMKCRSCQKGGNHEVFLLFAMSIRGLLRSLKRSSTASMENEPESIVGAGSSPSPPSNWRVVVGQYHVTGDDQRVVADTLLMLDIRRIEMALEYLKRRMEAARCTSFGCVNVAAPEETRNLDDFSLLEGRNEEGCRVLFSNVNFNEHIDSLLLNLEGIMRGMRSGHANDTDR